MVHAQRPPDASLVVGSALHCSAKIMAGCAVTLVWELEEFAYHRKVARERKFWEEGQAELKRQHEEDRDSKAQLDDADDAGDGGHDDDDDNQGRSLWKCAHCPVCHGDHDGVLRHSQTCSQRVQGHDEMPRKIDGYAQKKFIS